MRERLDRETVYPLIGMTAFSLLGAGIGLVAMPSAWIAVATMTLAQLLVTALGLRAVHRPVLWASTIAAVSLSSVVLDARLAALAYTGAIPWISLGTAMAALNLYRRADDWIAIWAGTAALTVSSASLVIVGISAGVPPTSAILSAAVPFLIGVIVALALHLTDARADRLQRPELSSGVDNAESRPTAGTVEAMRRALAIVALRSDELVTSTNDEPARRAAADLRDVAERALTDPITGHSSLARIELLSAVDSVDRQRSPAIQQVPPMPHLPDREREILRLVATGASNASIGRSLYLSEATVKQYVSRLMRRFERENRTQLALMAARWFEGA